MNILAAFGLLALLPAAVNANEAVPYGIEMAICTGAGNGRVVIVPVLPQKPVDGSGSDCWNKGCHAAGSRRQLSAIFDPPQ